MEVRAYYATTVEGAIETARREFGPDAMLVQSRRSPPETEHLGLYEVVFAGELIQKAPAVKKVSTVPEEVSLLEPLDLVSGQPELGPVRVGPRLTSVEPASQIQCKPGLGACVALVGPGGSGKTTMLMKLAIRYGIVPGKKIRILAIDHLRVGATEPLRRFAELLNIPFHACDAAEELSNHLVTRTAELTFIDTAGFARGQNAHLKKLAEYFSGQPLIETQLVLRMDRKTADNLTSLEQFAPLRAKRLILTALDETGDCKEIATILKHANIPVSFLGASPSAPDGLEAARPARMAELISRGWEAARAA